MTLEIAIPEWASLCDGFEDISDVWAEENDPDYEVGALVYAGLSVPLTTNDYGVFESEIKGFLIINDAGTFWLDADAARFAIGDAEFGRLWDIYEAKAHDDPDRQYRGDTPKHEAFKNAGL